MKQNMESYVIRVTLIFLMVFLLSSCAVNRIIGDKDKLTISYDSIDFKLSKIEHMGNINGYGSGVFSHVKNGKFFIVTLEAKNNSALKKEIDLDKIILCDSSKICLSVGRIDYNTIVDFPANRILKLLPNQKDGRHMFYAGPKDFVPMYIVINRDNNIYIKFDFNKK
ncbi:hypothetical protein [Flavobacterium sp. N1994]|uniref:hypothetical protein n=1 Tax=Flavobacterium sp. N1994 TaxID=2986827 RepID=UPI00222159B5|nr:hypothetical protein [Flavobacterium sp. N1994]